MELENITNIFFNGQKITVVIDEQNQAWFKAKEIAQILGYKDTRKAISSHIRAKHKRPYNSLVNLVNPIKIHYQTIFITEPGLYSLIISSKLDSAIKFQDWVFEILLPNIRKFGQYQINNNLNDKLKEKEKELVSYKEFLVNTKTIKKEGWIYIASTDHYQTRGIYKIGSTERLAKRLNSYNTGRIEEFYYVWFCKCFSPKNMEVYIQHLLKNFNYNYRKEMYCGIHISDLVEIIEFLCKNFDKSIEFVNFFVNNKLTKSISKEKIILPKKEITPDNNLIKEQLNIYFDKIEDDFILKKDELFSELELDKSSWKIIKELLSWKSSNKPIIFNNKKIYIQYK